MSEKQTFMPGDEYRPFSNGTQYHMWLAHNCEGCRKYKPEADKCPPACPIEFALSISCVGNQLDAEMGLRAGFLQPGPNGTLVQESIFTESMKCPERRGYDEPDDRPKRGPRPPKGQMDLLDPRNQETRQSAISAPSNDPVAASLDEGNTDGEGPE
jgi:hypothetical protein